MLTNFLLETPTGDTITMAPPSFDDSYFTLALRELDPNEAGHVATALTDDELRAIRDWISEALAEEAV